MPKRLVELYAIGDRVEITFDGSEWIAGVVVRHAHPAVWVQTDDGREWFVTNARRIRAAG